MTDSIGALFAAIIQLFVLVFLPGTSVAQDDWQHNFFTTSDGVRLHYIESGPRTSVGDDAAALVFVPGWTMPAWIWEHQINHFAESRRVAALDPRGHGDSEKPSFGYDHARRALDIKEFVEQLDEDQSVILVGWSLGVLEVVKYLDAHGSDAVSGTVLVDWAMYYDDPAAFSDRYVRLQTEREEWTDRFIDAIFRSEQSPEYIARVTEASLSTPTNATAIMIGNIILQGDTDLRPFMDAYEQPILFVYSSSSWSVLAAEEIREGWPKYDVEVIEDSGHTLFVDKPARFNRILAGFMDALPK